MSKEPKDKKQDAAEIDPQEFETEHGLILGKLPRDPDTGQILYDELTDEQREDLKRLHESTERMQAAATKAMKAREQLKQQRERLQEDREKIAKAKERAEEGKRYKETIDKYYKSAGQAISTESMQRLSESLGKFMQWFIDEQTGESWRAIIENLKPVSDLVNEIYENREQLDEELKKDCYDGRTVDDYLDNYTASKLLILSRDEDSDLYKALQATRAARFNALEIVPYKADKMLLPTDKVNLFAWDLKETGNQLKYKFDLSRAGTKDGATAVFSLSFDDDPDVKITKELKHFDKRVMCAVGTAYRQGQYILSATAIHYAMGNTKRPTGKDIEKINNALTKFDMGKVFIDNAAEADKYHYDHFRKEDRLLHFKRVTRKSKSNGKVLESYIQILEEPVLITFARQRKQISAVPICVLQSPPSISRTENNYRIEDYLLWRISRQKNKVNRIKKEKYTPDKAKRLKEAQNFSIMLDTFYKQTENAKKDNTGKKRARNAAAAYLEHYKSDDAGNYITDYKIDQKGGRIIINLPT